VVTTTDEAAATPAIRAATWVVVPHEGAVIVVVAAVAVRPSHPPEAASVKADNHCKIAGVLYSRNFFLHFCEKSGFMPFIYLNLFMQNIFIGGRFGEERIWG
jgi:hypothetical protein